MSEVLIRYRPSGGRGEFEWTQSDALLDKHIIIRIPQFGIDLPTEIAGRRMDGKPRLRKDQPNNREKLHIDGVITALAKLPEPSRSFQKGSIWPLEQKGYVVDAIWLEIAEANATSVTLVPQKLGVRGSSQTINLAERFEYIARELASGNPKHPTLDKAFRAFGVVLSEQFNSRDLRRKADAVIDLQTEIFGPSNAGSTLALEDLEELPATDLEDAPLDHDHANPGERTKLSSRRKGEKPTPNATRTEGREGRLLTRWHAYRERDRALVKSAKAAFKLNHGRLFCEACETDPATIYGPRGEDRLQAHHRTPIEEMIPGSVTKIEDLAMVCPSCHDIIHARRPWISVDEVRALLRANGRIK